MDLLGLSAFERVYGKWRAIRIRLHSCALVVNTLIVHRCSTN